MKFSIRDLFLVTFVVAVCVAWWVDHRRIVEENSQLKQRLSQKVDPLIKAQKEAEARVTGLRETLESGGFKVHWEQNGEELKIGIELPNSSSPAPNPSKP